MVSNQLTQELILEYRECFKLFDKEDKGFINLSDIGTAWRSLMAVPLSYDNLSDEIKISKKVYFDDFLRLMTKHLVGNYDGDVDSDAMLSALKEYSVQSNYITKEKASQVLMKFFNSEDDVELILKEAELNKENLIDIEELIKKIF